MSDIRATGQKRNFYNSYSHLSRDEEALLVARWYDLGDEEALARLYGSHRKLVAKVAREYHYGSYRNVPLDDLIQEATRGFLRAIDRNEEARFDPKNGARLNTYAFGTRENPSWVRKYIIEYADKTFKHGFYRKPENEQPALSSCNTPAFTNDESENAYSFGDFIPDIRSQYERGENWLSELPEELREIVRLREDEPEELSFDEIGAEFGCSRERVRKPYRECDELKAHYTHAKSILKFPPQCAETILPPEAIERDVLVFLKEQAAYRRHGIGYLRRSHQSARTPFDFQYRHKPHKWDWTFSGPRASTAVGLASGAKTRLLPLCRSYRPISSRTRGIQRQSGGTEGVSSRIDS
jgi:RNA polymerase sigma factor (sigma-70 family)